MDLKFLVDMLEYKVKEGTRELKEKKVGSEEYEKQLEGILGTLTVLGNFHKVGVPYEDILESHLSFQQRKKEKNEEELPKPAKEHELLGQRYLKFIDKTYNE